MKDKKIGFVGLGRMGGNMARCLKDKGYQVSALFDINQDLAQELATEIGATAYGSLAAVTANADIILTVVTNDAAMDAIFFGDDNLFTNASGKLFINCATLTPAVHVKLEEAAAKLGAQTLEGCMASSIPQARNGELYLMIGGQKPVFEAAKPLLDDLSKALTYVGASGKASEVKALVNMVMNINTAALAEGLGLGAALGLDLEMLCKVFSQTGANSRVLETDAEDMLNRDHDCFFSAAHAAKDSGIALELGKAKGVTMPLAQATLAQYNKLCELGLGELDKSGIAELTFPGRKGSE
ncbi:NAD(P)-dependent oxidoreductase [Pelagicoccus sp. NFK12]|uniref:NAD(P)-dependent oxidoreductase n=1 Tax=Pelagicoccus enzymogenes TaxID=2773457 RepID=A0A927F8Y9_9BACT|nr:NAD(P)-dependent oxidoreductase [Pelagicoccus enzymogenes]MBD5780677.1 NAD(P)-dependent oxidoreductase [Pelagicoccus enzymogenes]MDQ8201207.1 NAD(P)-dependent oxidoreductase [Pelagicoccus enzymogenes]